MPLTVGQTLGAGAMGEVYRARDARLDREVAITVLPDHFAEDAERLHRFEREAKSLAGSTGTPDYDVSRDGERFVGPRRARQHDRSNYNFDSDTKL